MSIEREILTHDDYNRIQDKCTRKNTVGNNRKGMMVDKKKVKNALLASCMLGAIASGVTITAGNSLVTTFKENSALTAECLEFHSDVISPNAHRTTDNKGYYYDYLRIAQEINKDGNISEEELYYTYYSLGEENTNNVIKYLHATYENVEDFLAQHNYKNIKDWRKAEVKKLSLKESIEKQQEELNAMQNDLQIQTATMQNTTLGGK